MEGLGGEGVSVQLYYNKNLAILCCSLPSCFTFSSFVVHIIDLPMVIHSVPVTSSFICCSYYYGPAHGNSFCACCSNEGNYDSENTAVTSWLIGCEH